MTPFLLCSYFRTHQTTLLKILGRTDAWAVPPPQFFWGDRPPAHPRSPPLLLKIFFCANIGGGRRLLGYYKRGRH